MHLCTRISCVVCDIREQPTWNVAALLLTRQITVQQTYRLKTWHV